MEIKNKYYKKLPNDQWKAYIQLFMKKGTKQRLYLKPGITEFIDIEARMFFKYSHLFGQNYQIYKPYFEQFIGAQ